MKILVHYGLITLLMLLAWPQLLAAEIAETRQDLAVLDSRLTDLPITGTDFLLSRDNLELNVSLPDSLDIPEQQVTWQVFNKRKLLHTLRGRKQTLQLSAAAYTVVLEIGHFSLSKQIDVYTNRKITPYFRARIGRLDALANQAVDWEVQEQNGKAFTVPTTRYINEIVPMGVYEVRTRVKDLMQLQRVHIDTGEAVQMAVKIPVGEVKLIAITDNHPLFKPVEWEVYRLDSGGRHHIGSYSQHSLGIMIPPGNYEAVATYAKVTRTRAFWVQQNTTNQVILAMDEPGQLNN